MTRNFNPLVVAIFLSTLGLSLSLAAPKIPSNKVSPKALVTVQATNNTKVPSVTYVVDAVHALEEAYSIYDNDEERATLYAALFEEMHPGNWDVLVGYSAFYVQADVYVETMVTAPKSKEGFGKKDDDSAGVLFLIFSPTAVVAPPNNSTNCSPC